MDLDIKKSFGRDVDKIHDKQQCRLFRVLISIHKYVYVQGIIGGIRNDFKLESNK